MKFVPSLLAASICSAVFAASAAVPVVTDTIAKNAELMNADPAMQALLRSLTYDAPRAEVCCDLGRLLMAQHHDAMAVFWYELALKRPVDSSTGGFHEPDCHGYIPCMQLCVLYDRLGDRRKAEAYNERAAALKPDDAGVAYNRAYFARKKAGA